MASDVARRQASDGAHLSRTDDAVVVEKAPARASASRSPRPAARVARAFAVGDAMAIFGLDASRLGVGHPEWGPHSGRQFTGQRCFSHALNGSVGVVLKPPEAATGFVALLDVERFGQRKVPGAALWPVSAAPSPPTPWPLPLAPSGPLPTDAEMGRAALRVLDQALAHVAWLRGTWLFGRLGRATDVILWGLSEKLASLSFHPPGRVDVFFANAEMPRGTIDYVGGEWMADRLAQNFSDERAAGGPRRDVPRSLRPRAAQRLRALERPGHELLTGPA